MRKACGWIVLIMTAISSLLPKFSGVSRTNFLLILIALGLGTILIDEDKKN